ncbi:MAG: biopolymer transporter ExbD [Phycisphaerae bacterium]|jgi:biopolymer transport protein ExbD|nr:biopolymer transporter ExbD [Phycisphaerae bacterium]
MSFKGSKSRVIIPIVELTPMIDIVFLLIIFFMVAAQFAQQAHVELQLPKEAGEQLKDKAQGVLVINVLRDGSIMVDKNEGSISLAVLEGIVGDSIGTDGADWKNITVRADENTLAKSLNEVLAVLHKFGLSATNIATESP